MPIIMLKCTMVYGPDVALFLIGHLHLSGIWQGL